MTPGAREAHSLGVTHASDPVRLIQVGLGGWGRDWLDVLRAEGQVRSVAWVDPSPAALAAAQQVGAAPERCFTSLREALAAVPADAVLVTASLAAHAPVSLEALRAGLPVLVEKPFAPTMREAGEVVRAARERGLTLMVSQNYRHQPAARAAAEVVRSGQLGPAGPVSVEFRRDYARRLPAGAAHHALLQPLLMDMAVHHFDLMRLLLGRAPRSVDCYAYNPPWSPYRDPASAVATVVFEGGAVVAYQGSWASSGPPTPWGGVWRVECEKGDFVWVSRGDPDEQADELRLRPSGEAGHSLTLPKLENRDRAGVLAAFVAALRSGQTPETSGEENLSTLAMSLAAVRSAREGRQVDIAELLAEAQETG